MDRKIRRDTVSRFTKTSRGQIYAVGALGSLSCPSKMEIGSRVL